MEYPNLLAYSPPFLAIILHLEFDNKVLYSFMISDTSPPIPPLLKRRGGGEERGANAPLKNYYPLPLDKGKGVRGIGLK
jgi:hypothetical protein